MTTLADPTFQQFLAAEKAQESGGNYGAHSGAGAVGAYQILASNIPEWSKEALGYSISEQEFLDSPSLQDTIAAHKLLEYVNKYGYAGAAAMWFSGQPDPNSQASDGGISVQGYVQDVLGRMGNPNFDPSQPGFTTPNAFPAATPELSLDSLRQTDPLVAALITSVPELNNIFKQAVAGSWSSDKFISAVQNSHWWATHSDSARQAFATMKADPATWNRQVTQLQTTLQNMAAELGAIPTQNQLHSLALDALINGYDQNQAMLRQKFAEFVKPVAGLHFGGEAGSDETQLRQMMMNMGVFLPEHQLDSALQKIIAGQWDVTGVQGELRNQAAAMYPAYKNLIDQGVNVSDIADPYIQQAQNLLEQGPGQINIMNPLIRNALQHTVNGKPTPLSLTDFEVQLRQNPQWRQTNNAQNDIMGTAHQVLQDFGLAY